MDSNALKKYASSIMPECDRDVFERLYDSKVIDKQLLLKACINHFYSESLKNNNCSVMVTYLDTAIEFEISVATVKNTIYKFNNVRLKF